MHYESLYEENMLSAPALKNCGFEEAPTATLPNVLYRTQPNQWTACLKDSILAGLLNFQKLQTILLQAGTAKRWKFYNVIVCTLPDKISKITRKQMIEQIIRINSNWQVAEFKVFIIPISMGDSDIQDILTICEIGGPNWQYYPTDMDYFAEHFKTISQEMSMNNKRSLLESIPEDKYSQDYVKQAPYKDYSLAITLTLQASSNMTGGRWEQIINIISYYMRNLGPKDVISGIVYNSRPYIVAKNEILLNNQEMQPERAIQAERIRQAVPDQQYIQNQPVYNPQPVYNAQPVYNPQPYIQPQYANYAVPPPRRQNNCGKACGIICCIFVLGFIIRLIVYSSASS